MTSFPSSIVSFSTKINGQVIDAGDINSPQNEITALETKVGVDNSSVASSLDYKVTNPLSDGGGHIQSANKGGTGQTMYQKGDLLVAQSVSVLGKLSVGADGTSPIADSSQSTGISWGNVTAALPYAQDGGTGSVYAISPVPCVASLSPGQIFVAKITNTNTVVSPALSVSSLLARKIVNSDRSSVMVGQIISSALTVFGYDASASVMQLLNPTYTPWVYISSATGNGGTGTTITAPANANFAILQCVSTASNVDYQNVFVIAKTGATTVSGKAQMQSTDSTATITASWSGTTITVTLSGFTNSNNTAYFYT